MSKMVETEVLIVGAGPAGAMAALLLSEYGIKNLVINKFRSTSPGPRSHITNQRTMEILRDVGLEAKAKNLATPQEYMANQVYAESLVGEEFGRIRTWQNHPARKAEHDLASPTSVCDLPQLYFEPMVIQSAMQRGSDVRFSTEYLSHTQDEDGVKTTLRDLVAGTEYEVWSRYLIGADGARSKVATDIELPLEGQMAEGDAGAINVEFTADLSRFVDHRRGDMFMILQPGTGVRGNGMSVLRMVRPWNHWVAILGYDLASGPPALDDASAKAIVHRLIGTTEVDVTIAAISSWTHNRVYATSNTRGRVFCMGDAVHRHAPLAGLGLNTSVQDAYNLCWKLAFVLKGRAGSELLASYDAERSPVAKRIVEYASDCRVPLRAMFEKLRLPPRPTAQHFCDSLAALKSTTAEGAAMRSEVRAAIAGSVAGFGGGYGVEMNQRYTSSAVVDDGTRDPGFSRDPSTYYEPSSRPGAHLPHAWLTSRQQLVSTLDLCGGGRFTLITGLSGQRWKEVAAQVSKELGVEIAVQVIGPGADYQDIYGDFESLAGIGDDGALLVRPDMFIAWRAPTASSENLVDLGRSLRKVLSRDLEDKSCDAGEKTEVISCAE